MAINSLKIKVEELVERHRITLDENKNLKMKNTELTNLLNQQEREIKELLDSNKLLKLSDGVKTRGNTKETNLKINELVREIDKCIAQLNR